MISVIIATHDSERPLVQTLAALVPGAMAGVVREVIVADAGSQDGTAKVADVAGCRFVVTLAPIGARLKAAAALARASWFLFLRPGAVPDASWIDETNRFIQEVERSGPDDALAAVFRPTGAVGRRRPVVVEVFALLAEALGASPRPEQGLLISRPLYESLGGHKADGADPEGELLRRLGRRRFVVLQSGVAQVR